MSTLAVVVVVIAVLFWLASVAHWVMLFAYLRDGLTPRDLLFRGYLAWSSSTYTQEGQPLYRRMAYSFLGFVCTVLVGSLVASLT